MRRRSRWSVASWASRMQSGGRPSTTSAVAPSARPSKREHVKSRLSPKVAATESPATYDADFFDWTRRTAALLRARRIDEVDVEHAAQEIEDMGRRDVRELNRRMRVLLAHLLKWQLQQIGRASCRERV